MRKHLLDHNNEIGQEPSEVVIKGVRFWRECPDEDKPLGFLPMKLVFTEENINGTLVFFESHGLIYSDRAVAQIREEIKAHGEADVWILTHK